MKILDLENIAITGKDLVTLVGVLWIVFQAWEEVQDLKAQIIENRLATVNMELSWMEGQVLDKTGERKYELKHKLAEQLQKRLEDLQ